MGKLDLRRDQLMPLLLFHGLAVHDIKSQGTQKNDHKAHGNNDGDNQNGLVVVVVCCRACVAIKPASSHGAAPRLFIAIACYCRAAILLVGATPTIVPIVRPFFQACPGLELVIIREGVGVGAEELGVGAPRAVVIGDVEVVAGRQFNISIAASLRSNGLSITTVCLGFFSFRLGERRSIH